MSALDRCRAMHQDADHDAIVAHCELLRAMRVHGPCHSETWVAWRACASVAARVAITAAAVARGRRRA